MKISQDRSVFIIQKKIIRMVLSTGNLCTSNNIDPYFAMERQNQHNGNIDGYYNHPFTNAWIGIKTLEENDEAQRYDPNAIFSACQSVISHWNSANKIVKSCLSNIPSQGSRLHANFQILNERVNDIKEVCLPHWQQNLNR